MRPTVKRAYENSVARYPNTIAMLAEMERWEREEGMTEREAARSMRDWTPPDWT